MTAAAKRWGVQFNENALAFYGSRAAAEWWLPWRRHMDRAPGKIIILNSSAPGGDLLIIRASDREEAEFIHGHMLGHGIPAGCLKVRAIPDELAA